MSCWKRVVLLSYLIVFSILLFPAQNLAGQTPPSSAALDTLTRNGFTHFYAQEYDQALHDFQKVLDSRPDDPASVNHLLEAILFGELFKYNALDTQMYTSLKFLGSKQVPIDADTKKKIKDLTDRSLKLSNDRLKADPKDAQALYTRGVAEGLRATYLAVVEHSWFASLRSALSARHDHEQVLKLKPDYVDAKMIVGAHNYIVGNLSVPVKIMAGITGIHGDKDKGLRYLAEAGNGGGESSADARVALALFLRKEGRHKEAIDVVRTLTRDHPRNFLFALEEGNLLKDSGQNAEAVASYRKVLAACKEGHYPAAHTEMALFDMGDALRNLNQYQEALQAYQAAEKTGADADLHQRAQQAAREVSEKLGKH